MTYLTRFLILASLAASPALAEMNDAAPNATGQQPAFEGQTRAPALTDDIALTQTTLAEKLEHPWGMALLPDGATLITERPGRLRLLSAEGALSEPLKGVPEVDNRQQGGLLDVAIAPDFADTRRVWLSFSEPRGWRKNKNSTSVATGILSADGSGLEDVKVIFRQDPAWGSLMHFGSRLVFSPEGALYVTTGERSYDEPRVLAQDVNTHLGKVLRIDPLTGKGIEGNPFADGRSGKPEIWSYGHRNIQAAALNPATGELWTVEHGPAGGDELNKPEAGKNYGWPVITYGQDYSGGPIGEGKTQQEGMEQPVYYWDPVIAPSGMAFYQGEMFPELQGDALIGGLGAQAVVRLKLQGDRVTGEQRLAEGIGRVRDVEIAPDGAILVLIDDPEGSLIRLAR